MGNCYHRYSVIKALISLFHNLLRLQGTPVALARGTAVGVGIGLAPLSPFKSVLLLFFTLATKSSTVAAFITCTIICNPLTYLPLYYLAYVVGNVLLPGRAGWTNVQFTLVRVQEAGLVEATVLVGHLGLSAMVVLLTGGLALAVPVALFSYPVALHVFRRRERLRSARSFTNPGNDAKKWNQS
ncbi:DUF2062 domain-containing protein [Desulfobulbus alkaliphilus]|uniref:DUF2062 domain-containing protein n=1 Tax=Desulfobulbus alkaliphilus TaxID=869814 RepID=UPI00196271A6|nr:DUF2062 domain-containing protein [Desulfobulbus alkaliphilus]MBM9537202.1 DUF2062 domain-containing protein [Desulfobulbus alkaliphilus]